MTQNRDTFLEFQEDNATIDGEDALLVAHLPKESDDSWAPFFRDMEVMAKTLQGNNGIDELSSIIERLSEAGHTSPIELAMLIALWIELASSLGGMKVVFDKWEFFAAVHWDYTTATVRCQEQIGKYRADFVLEYASLDPSDVIGPKVVVECDGHDHHERTKQQAKHDRQRDRFMQSKGYKILRFTGSEIWEDPFACAREALREARKNPSRTSRSIS